MQMTLQTYIPPPKDCPKCPRLCGFHAENRVKYPEFFNGAVPSFGALDSEFLVVGLAPGLKGANATSIPFTGDYAGDILYPALARHGYMEESSWFTQGKLPSEVFRSTYQQPEAINHKLKNCRITNAVRCVPPENKPTSAEINECNPFLTAEISAMKNLKVILTLGLVSHKAVLKAFGYKQSAFKFGHGAVHQIELDNGDAKGDERGKTLTLLNSYHTSRYNINTNRLTYAMFDAIITQATQLMKAA